MPPESLQLRKNSRRGPVAVLVLLVLLVAAGLGIRARVAHECLFPGVDDVFYMEQARELVATGSLPFSTFPPGWPLLMALPLRFGDLADPNAPLRAAQLMNVILGTVLGLLVFLMLRERCGAPIALLGAAIVLFLPENLLLAKRAMSENAYTCVILASWLLLSRRRLVPAGLALGYAYLIRPEALLIAVAVAIFLLIRERSLPWRFVAAVLVPVVPYLLFIHSQSGTWSLTGKGMFLARTTQEHPGLRIFALAGRNLVVLGQRLIGLVGLPLVLLSLLGIVRRPGRWLLFCLPLLILPFFSFAMVTRFWVPYLPFLLLAAGLAGNWLLSKLSRPLGRWRALGVCLLVMLILGGSVMAGLDDAPEVPLIQESYLGLKVAGMWLRNRVDRDTVVMSYKPYPSFWAWCKFARCPGEASAETILDSAREQGARYLVVNLLVARALVPGLQPFFEKSLPPSLRDQVTLVKSLRFRQDIKYDTLIYRIEPAVLQPTPRARSDRPSS